MKTSSTAKTFYFIAAVLITLVFLFPLVWMLFTAVKPESEAMTYPPTMFPTEWIWQNFASAWTSQPFTRYTFNTVLVSFFNILGQLIAGSLAAYGFARYEFKGKNILFGLLLASMMLPWDVTVIPQYMQFSALGWIDTFYPLVVPALFGSAYYIYLMRQYIEQISNEYAEAARIDGAGELQTYAQIYMPIIRPILSLVVIQTLLTVWNDYLGPLVFLNSRNNYTLALGLASFKGVHTNAIVPTMAIAVVMTIIPIIVYLLAQRQIVEGMTEGGVKG